jgi:hypothetical protein
MLSGKWNQVESSDSEREVESSHAEREMELSGIK